MNQHNISWSSYNTILFPALEKVGEAALEKSGGEIQAIRKAVQEKLKSTTTDGVLAIAEADPAEADPAESLIPNPTIASTAQRANRWQSQ